MKEIVVYKLNTKKKTHHFSSRPSRFILLLKTNHGFPTRTSTTSIINKKKSIWSKNLDHINGLDDTSSKHSSASAIDEGLDSGPDTRGLRLLLISHFPEIHRGSVQRKREEAQTTRKNEGLGRPDGKHNVMHPKYEEKTNINKYFFQNLNYFYCYFNLNKYYI